MAYRNKTYICFDADTNMSYYRLMQAWNENGNIAFNFHNAHELNNLRQGSSEETIKTKLRERMSNSRVALVLIGEHTKDLYKFVRWEIEQAQKMELPLIGVNLNKRKYMDPDLCPAILRDSLAMHIAFGQKIIDFALNNWTSQHYDLKRNNDSGPYYYGMNIYKNLYPDFMNQVYRSDESHQFYSS